MGEGQKSADNLVQFETILTQSSVEIQEGAADTFNVRHYAIYDLEKYRFLENFKSLN